MYINSFFEDSIEEGTVSGFRGVRLRFLLLAGSMSFQDITGSGFIGTEDDIGGRDDLTFSGIFPWYRELLMEATAFASMEAYDRASPVIIVVSSLPFRKLVTEVCRVCFSPRKKSSVPWQSEGCGCGMSMARLF
jgi:hypothetical protein